jgi:hypothetical protein
VETNSTMTARIVPSRTILLLLDLQVIHSKMIPNIDMVIGPHSISHQNSKTKGHHSSPLPRSILKLRKRKFAQNKFSTTSAISKPTKVGHDERVLSWNSILSRSRTRERRSSTAENESWTVFAGPDRESTLRAEREALIRL